METTKAKQEQIEVWITKYALTEGAFKVKAVVCKDISESMIRTDKRGHFHGSDWHRTEESALQQVGKLIAAKRRSLQQSLDKLAVLEQMHKYGKFKVSRTQYRDRCLVSGGMVMQHGKRVAALLGHARRKQREAARLMHEVLTQRPRNEATVQQQWRECCTHSATLLDYEASRAEAAGAALADVECLRRHAARMRAAGEHAYGDVRSRTTGSLGVRSTK